MTMRTILFLIPFVLVTGCGRPAEVRSVASAALPIAASLKTTAASQQSRFALQRDELDGRASELAQQAALARASANDIELDWKFAGDSVLPKKLAMYREGDAAIIASPLASIAPVPALSSKPAALDLGPLNTVVGGFDALRQKRKPDGKELFSYFQSVNAKLLELQDEQKKPAK